jgi:CDGSH iron-sulfur domain-containing protein 3
MDNNNLPNIAQKFPFEIELEAGKTYAWCACGLSGKEPFCDSAHKQVEGVPIRSFKFEATETGKAYLCGCKHTKNPPYCDGSHKSL